MCLLDAHYRKYTELENEFRNALQIEDKRFNDVQQSYQKLKQEYQHVSEANRELVEREQRAKKVIEELTALVREMQEQLAAMQSKADMRAKEIQSSKEQAEREQQVAKKECAKVALLTAELDKLNAKVVAQDSLLWGLKEEKTLWSKELAAQGASLAADRGRLEAQITALILAAEQSKSEIAELKEALKIKNAMLDDQADSIKKLKSELFERDHTLRTVKEESQKASLVLQEKIAAEKRANDELAADLQAAVNRKQELKDKVHQLTLELDSTRQQFAEKERQWKDRNEFIGQLEAQVAEIRTVFGKKETNLQHEKEKAVQERKELQEAMQKMEHGFQIQVESRAQQLREYHIRVERLQQENLLMQQQLESNEKEMRAILTEAEQRKRAAAAKIAQLTQLLHEMS
jgi:leucine-rich repeat/coiled-coil domain-containing protein 1